VKFELIFVGKTSEKFLTEGIDSYFRKLKYFIPLEIITISPSKSKTALSHIESEEIFKHITPKDFIILLDEKGKQLDSVRLSGQIQKWMNQSLKKIVFITGGAYGVDESVKERADYIWALSDLTFTHQMVRLILLEQLYRAMTIIKGTSYHHE
jgi:23S rRNA (pseudouridine1915-N3)-methyltransferase